MGAAGRMARGPDWAPDGVVIRLHLFSRDMLDKYSQIYVFGVDLEAASP